MSKNEAGVLLDKAVRYGYSAIITDIGDGSWRVRVSKDGRWIVVVDDEDFDDAREKPELWEGVI